MKPCPFKRIPGERRLDVALCFSGRQPHPAKTRRKTHLDPQKREQTVKDQHGTPRGAPVRLDSVSRVRMAPDAFRPEGGELPRRQ